MSKITQCAVVLLGIFSLVPAGVWGQNSGSEGIEPEFSPCPGTQFEIGFGSAGDVFMFYLTPTGKGTVRVSVADLYLFGPDIWRVELHEVGKPGKSNVGNGVVGDYAGTLTKNVKPGRNYQFIISADSVPAGFIAGMGVCVEGPVTVTYVP